MQTATLNYRTFGYIEKGIANYGGVRNAQLTPCCPDVVGRHSRTAPPDGTLLNISITILQKPAHSFTI